MSDVIFKGSSGKIDAFYHHNLDPNSQIVIILHGNKDDEINNKQLLDILFNNFVQNNFSVLKINFKIKTKKEEENAQEIDLFDSTIALNWLYEKNQETKGCWIVGYNKASLTALQLVMRRPEIENYLLISPFFKKSELNFIVPCISYGYIIKSDRDLNISDNDLIDIQEKLITKTESKIETETLVSSQRNFSDIYEEFNENINTYIKNRLAEFFKNSKTSFEKKRRRRKKKADDNNENKMPFVNPIKPLDFDNL